MSQYGHGPGIKTEDLIKELLTACGWSVIETRKAADDGRAPMLEADGGATRLPDFQAVRPEPGPQYVEVKSKAKPREYGIEDSLRHGYEKPKHDDYLAIAEESDTPLHVFVHEREPGVVLRQRVRDLTIVQTLTDEETLERYFNTTEPMVFFERSQFEVVTDDITQFSAGFGQSGLLDDEIDLNPFGFEPDGSQGRLDEWGGPNE
jgi:hypothetical protein